jgi:hypothetical protein
VQGGAVQAWQATPLPAAAADDAPTVDYFLTGTASDQVSKLAGRQPGELRQGRADGAHDATQNAEGGTEDGTPTCPGTA